MPTEPKKPLDLPKKFIPKDHLVISDPETVNVIFHDKRSKLLEILVESEMTVYDLKTKLKWNPGVVKRHLDKLLEANLIEQTRTAKNEMGMILKYYRACAKSISIQINWP